MKAGIKTTEFWTAVAPIAAVIAHAFGFGADSGAVQSTAGSIALTILSTWLGGSYMSGRLKLKTEPDVRQHIVDATVDKLRSVVETEIAKRLPETPAAA